MHSLPRCTKLVGISKEVLGFSPLSAVLPVERYTKRRQSTCLRILCCCARGNVPDIAIASNLSQYVSELDKHEERCEQLSQPQAQNGYKRFGLHVLSILTPEHSQHKTSIEFNSLILAMLNLIFALPIVALYLPAFVNSQAPNPNDLVPLNDRNITCDTTFVASQAPQTSQCIIALLSMSSDPTPHTFTNPEIFVGLGQKCRVEVSLVEGVKEETTSWLYLQTMATQLMLGCNDGGRVVGEARGGSPPDGRIRMRIAKQNRWPWLRRPGQGGQEEISPVSAE